MGKNGGGRNFKPGQSGNPNGRPKVPRDMKNARALDKSEIDRIMNRLLNLKPGELENEIKTGELTSKEMCVAVLISKAMEQGDSKRLDFILNRLIGKVIDQPKAETSSNSYRPLAHLTDEELDAL